MHRTIKTIVIVKPKSGSAQPPASAGVFCRRVGPVRPSPTPTPVSSNRHTQSPVSGFVYGIPSGHIITSTVV